MNPFALRLHLGRRTPTLLVAALLLSATPVKSGDLTPSGKRWPTDASRRITSTFGEPRPDRFHAAIDFSTAGGVGYPCFAVEDGDVIRVRVNFSGYGKVVYLRMANGKIAVYAHLSRFDERIEERVRKRQIELGGYEVELFFKQGELHYKMGDKIAYTGDTGAGPPHLHFELREGLGTPFNPALDGYVVKDTQAPIIRRVAVRPLDGSSEANADMMPVIERFSGGSAPSVRVYGRIGISAEVVDFQDGGWHRLGPRRIELYLDGRLLHATELTKFNYQHNRDSRLDFDFELQKRGYKRFRRLYIMPGNNLGFYERDLPGGIIDTRHLEPGRHTVTIRALDDAGNERHAELPLLVAGGPSLPSSRAGRTLAELPESAVQDTSINLVSRIIGETLRLRVSGLPGSAKAVQVRVPALGKTIDLIHVEKGRWVGRIDIPLSFRNELSFEAVAEMESGEVVTKSDSMGVAGFLAGLTDRWSLPELGFEVRVGPGDLWYDLLLGLTSRPQTSETLTQSVRLRPYDYAYQRPIEVAFHSGDQPWHPQAVVVYREWSHGGRWMYLGNVREMNGFVLSAEAFSNETFSVALDTLAPEIMGVSYSDGASTTRKQPLFSVRVVDALSGLDLSKCTLQLDGEDTIWIYDPDRDTISFRPWEDLDRGLHTWRVVAIDKVGNTTVLERTLRIK